MQGLAPQERMQGLPPEERMQGLTPEKLLEEALKSLTPAQIQAYLQK